ncbi:hypothetical protein GIB67_021694 [Kingdonia uniflora]|uniref:DNA-directed RNA polymerase n=1 Tax=Kingdonia uniflora TaxID=39325 RepID=A0A7J7LMG5_9MAGN|nr:hypothetical protein GIB67_021694 [Kingdonia uniflora]
MEEARAAMRLELQNKVIEHQKDMKKVVDMIKVKDDYTDEEQPNVHASIVCSATVPPSMVHDGVTKVLDIYTEKVSSREDIEQLRVMVDSLQVALNRARNALSCTHQHLDSCYLYFSVLCALDSYCCGKVVVYNLYLLLLVIVPIYMVFRGLKLLGSLPLRVSGDLVYKATISGHARGDSESFWPYPSEYRLPTSLVEYETDEIAMEYLEVVNQSARTSCIRLYRQKRNNCGRNKGKRNKGKANTAGTRAGVSQVLNRLTYASTLSHLRRLNSPIGPEGKLAKPRQLYNSQWGMMCPAETLEGQACGLVKNLALMVYITLGSATNPILEFLEWSTENCWNSPKSRSLDEDIGTAEKTCSSSML